jgi:hypothetical protein
MLLPFGQSDGRQSLAFQLRVSADEPFFTPAAGPPMVVRHLLSHQCSAVKRRFRPAANGRIFHTSWSPLNPSSPLSIHANGFACSQPPLRPRLLDVVSARVDRGAAQRRAIGRASPTRVTRPGGSTVESIPHATRAYRGWAAVLLTMEAKCEMVPK